MSLEEEINHLAACIVDLQSTMTALTAAMQTLTATAAVEIEAKTDRPTIEVLKFGTDEHTAAMPSWWVQHMQDIRAKPKKHRGRPAGIREESPRRVCRSRCCGAEHHRRSKDDGKCFSCR